MEIGLKGNRVALLLPNGFSHFDGKHLFIVFQTMRWVALVVDQNKILAFEEYEYHIDKEADWVIRFEEWKNFSHLFKFSYTNVSYSYLTTHQIVFPVDFINLDRDLFYFSALFRALPYQNIIWQKQKIGEPALLEILQPIPEKLEKNLELQFPNAQNIRYLSVADVLYKRYVDIKKDQIILMVSDTMFALLVLEKGNFKAYNVFDYMLEDDIYYHVFNLCNQVGLVYNRAHLSIVYQTSTFLRLYNFFNDYFASVEEINPLDILTDPCITTSVSRNNQLLFMCSQV